MTDEKAKCEGVDVDVANGFPTSWMRVDAPVQEVTLYEDRAQVIREAKVAVPKGFSRLLIGGATPFLDDRSLWAKCAEEGVSILSAKVHRRAIVSGSDDLIQLEKNFREKASAAFVANRTRALADEKCKRLASVGERLVEALDQIPESSTLPQWTDALLQATNALDEAIAQSVDASWKTQKAIQEGVKARKAWARCANAQPKIASWIEVQIQSAADQEEVALQVGYRTPCALWRPEYVAKLLDGEGEKRPLIVQRRGAVWQSTGEDWRNVKLILSTERPAQQAQAPKLKDDVLALRKKSSEEMKTVAIEVRDQAIGRVSAAGDLSQMPGVDDGGEPRSFTSNHLWTIPSDGLAHHMDLGSVEMVADTSLVCIPELSETAMLRATTTLPASEMPLLAGPVQLSRKQSFVGKTQIGFIAPGEEFSLGFGVDNGLSIRRHSFDSRKEATLTTKQSVCRTVNHQLTNLSGEDRHLTIEERIPVSEIDEVKVSLDKVQGFDSPDADGILRARVHLAPNEYSRVSFVFTVTASDKVKLDL